MFERRLLLLAAGALVVLAGLSLQLTRLTTALGEQARARAELALSQRSLIPTVRGSITDRAGRVLAEDRATFDVAVAYPVISGRWSYEMAYRAARRSDITRWRRLDPVERENLIAKHQGVYDQQVRQLWDTLATLGKVQPAELSATRRTILRRVEQIASDVWSRRWAARSADADADDSSSFADITHPIGEQEMPHAVLFDVSNDARFAIERMIVLAQSRPKSDDPSQAPDVWKQVVVKQSWKRVYPLTSIRVSVDRSHFPGPLQSDQPGTVDDAGVGTHFLGAIRDIWADDQLVKDRPFKKGDGTEDLSGYLPGDKIGYWGVERAYESVLRGLRGQVIDHLDSQRQDRTEPMRGGDVRLSIDIKLQARVQALMDPSLGLLKRQPWHSKAAATSPDLGKPLYGAVVVLDVSSGQVLAAVSTPTFTHEQFEDDPQSLWTNNPDRPFTFRPIAQPYAAGSTIKPLVLSAATTDRKIRPGETIDCQGMLDPRHPGRFRCWIFKEYHSSHGPLAGPEAIARSCNVFFYTLGRRLGPERLVWWYQQFGLGQPTGCGLWEEVGGDLPRLATPQRPGTPLTEGDAINMGIGQGPMRWTPMQAASAYAAIARGGYLLEPTFVTSVGGRPVLPRGRDLRLDPAGMEMALRGLTDGVNQKYGTSHAIVLLNHQTTFDFPGATIMGKSGTAAAAPERIDSNLDDVINGEDEVVRSGDHAWFVGLVQPKGATGAKYVIAVVVEFAGSGGAVSGPIANQILYAMRAEGYL